MKRTRKIQLIPVEHIRVVNPRSRDQKKFAEISSNIETIGLKMPITVRIADKSDGIQYYDLTCGQGRLETFINSGQKEIAAFVTTDTQSESLLKSLVENMARKRHSAIDQFSEIRVLKERGYTISQIASKIDLDLEFTRGVYYLLEHGEDKLLNAVANSRIPISLAMSISKLEDSVVQEAIAELYTQKKLNGRAVEYAIRLVQQRKIGGKGVASQTSKKRTVTAASFKEEFDREIAKQQRAWKDLKLIEGRLSSLEGVMRRLLKDDNFITLLRAENLNQAPESLMKAEGLNA